MSKLRYYIPGSMLILFGFLIVAFPEILVALVALSLIMFGFGALYLGYLTGKSEAGWRDFSSEFSKSDTCRTWFGRVPFGRVHFRNTGFFH